MTGVDRETTSPPLSDQTAEESNLRVWLADPFCFTPWYSAALAGALRVAGAKIRLIATNVAREPDYFARCGLRDEPGPFRFDGLARHCGPHVKKILRASAVAANTAVLMSTLRRGARGVPDVLHLQQLPALNHGILIDFSLIARAQRYGVPVVHTVHNLLPHDSGETLRGVYQRLYAAVDHLICHSPDVADALVTTFGINSRSISVVPHGPLFEETSEDPGRHTRARQRLKIAPERPVVLWQGIMAPYKGLDVLLQAWVKCMQDWPGGAVRPLLLIAGAGTAAEETRALAAAENHAATIRADIRYIATAELPHYYRAADLLVFPYKNITTSGALLTGLSYRKPIVASDLLPFRQYLHHGENALLVPAGDAGALAAALAPLLRDIAKMHCPCAVSLPASDLHRGHSYQDLLHGAAQNRALYTGWDVIAKRTLAIYRQLVR